MIYNYNQGIKDSPSAAEDQDDDIEAEDRKGGEPVVDKREVDDADSDATTEGSDADDDHDAETEPSANEDECVATRSSTLAVDDLEPVVVQLVNPPSPVLSPFSLSQSTVEDDDSGEDTEDPGDDQIT